MLLTENPKLRLQGLTIRKKLGHPAELGEIILGESFVGDCSERNGIYQMRKTKRGKQPIRENHYYPHNPRTEVQQAWRATFAQCVADWQDLPAEQKQLYNEQAKGKHYTGFNHFIKICLKSH